MRMALISPIKPGIKAGKSSIALCAEPAYPECSGFGEGLTFAIKLLAHGMRDR